MGMSNRDGGYGAHPGWCDPRHCSEADGDIEHCSTPRPLRIRDALVTLAWVRADEHDCPGQPGDVELRVEVVHPKTHDHDTQPYLVPDTQLYLLPQEAYRVATALLAEYYRQQFLGAPALAGALGGAP